MPFENDTNHGRVLKMVALLEAIRKSAASNRAETPAVAALPRQLTDALDIPEGGPAPRPCPAPQVLQKTPHWSSVRVMAETADLEDLTVAMAIYLDRIHDLFKP